MARIFTWTGRGGDGGKTLLKQQFAALYEQGNYPAFANVPAMGGYCLSLANFGCGIQIAFPSAKSEFYFGMRMLPTAQDAGGRIMSIMSGTTIIAGVTRYNAGTNNPFPAVGVYRGDLTTWLAGGNINVDCMMHPYFLEIYYKPDATVGRFVTKINGKIDADYTGQTVPASQTTVDSLWLGCKQYTSNIYWYFNDIVIDDEDWPGMVLFGNLVPTGAGNSAQWSPSAGSNYECVDESPGNMADYNKTNTADKTDNFTTGDLPAAADVVKSVNVRVLAVKESAPTPTQVKALVRTGSTPTDYLGDAEPPGIYLTEITKLWEQNPYTSAGWTVSEVNAMEIGYKSVA